MPMIVRQRLRLRHGQHPAVKTPRPSGAGG